MIPISPVTAETCAPFIGKPVCAVTVDGRHHYGILRGIGDGNLYLDGVGDGLSLASVRGKRRKDTKPDKAHTKAFFGFGFGAFAISLALLASLFFIPWFFI